MAEEAQVIEAPKQDDNAVFNQLEGLLNGNTPEQPQTTESIVVETPVQTETPQVEQPTATEQQTVEIIIGDEPAEAQPKASAQPDNFEDFDTKFAERFSKEFGVDLNTAKQRLKDADVFEAKTKELGYKTEHGKVIDELLSKGISPDVIFNVALKDFDKADDLQALDYLLQIENPNATAEQRQAYLEETYKQGEDYLEREKLSGALKMQQDAKAAKEKLAQFKISSTQSPIEKQQADYQQMETQRLATWQSGLTKKAVETLPEIKSTLKLNVSYDGVPKEVEVPIRIQPSAKDKAELQAFIEENLPNFGHATADANGVQWVQEVMRNKYLVSNWDKILQTAVNQANSVRTEQEKKYLHHEVAPRHNTPVSGGGTATSMKDIETQLLSIIGG